METINKQDFDRMIKACMTDHLQAVESVIRMLRDKKELGNYYLKMGKTDENLQIFAEHVREIDNKIKWILGL